MYPYKYIYKCPSGKYIIKYNNDTVKFVNIFGDVAWCGAPDFMSHRTDYIELYTDKIHEIINRENVADNINYKITDNNIHFDYNGNIKYREYGDSVEKLYNKKVIKRITKDIDTITIINIKRNRHCIMFNTKTDIIVSIYGKYMFRANSKTHGYNIGTLLIILNI